MTHDEQVIQVTLERIRRAPGVSGGWPPGGAPSGLLPLPKGHGRAQRALFDLLISSSTPGRPSRGRHPETADPLDGWALPLNWTESARDLFA